MSFTLQTWQDQANLQFHKVGEWVERAKHEAAPYLLYGGLCGLSLWPLVEAAQKGQMLDVMLALGTVASGVGGNLIANQVQRWKDNTDRRAAEQWVIEQAPANEEVRAALDAILDKLKAIPQAQAGLGEADRVWFAQALRQELSQLGNLAHFESQLIGSGAMAQGQGAVAAGAGGVAVGGDVHGDIVMGNTSTVFDQRGQQVDKQYNIAGDWKAGDMDR
jgi:hypothetical protein